MKLLTGKPRTFVVSAYRDEYSPNTNARRATRMADTFEAYNIPHAIGYGSWKGQHELVVIVVGAQHERIVKRIARAFNQDYYLCIAENDRQAYVVDTETGYHTAVGALTFSESKPETDNWTQIDGRYYFARANSKTCDLPEGI